MMGSSGSSESNALGGLLALITDPEASKERLATLQKQAADTEKVLIEARELSLKAEADKAELKKLHDDLDAKTLEHKRYVSDTSSALNLRESDLQSMRISLDNRTAGLALRTDALTKAEAEHKAKVEAFQAKMDIEHKELHDSFISEMNRLHEENNLKLAAIQKQADDLAATKAATMEAKEAADRDKAFWEQKVSALKQAIG